MAYSNLNFAGAWIRSSQWINLEYYLTIVHDPRPLAKGLIVLVSPN